MPEVLLGLDLGTTTFKASVIDTAGNELTCAAMPTPWRPQAGHTCLTVSDARAAMTRALTSALNPVAHPHVLGIGVAGMAESGFVVNSRNQEVTPAIAWHEPVGTDEVCEIERWLGAESFASHTGLPLTSRCTAAKARWLRTQHTSESSSLRWENLPEWAVRQLGGQPMPEQSLAGRTGFLDLSTTEWMDELLRWSGLSPRAMNPPVPAGTPAGRVRGSLGACHPGLAGAVLTVAGHDHLCASIGAGATFTTDAFDSFGTGEAIIRTLPTPPTRPQLNRAVTTGFTINAHTLPGHWVLFAGLGSGRLLTEVLRTLSIDGADRTSLDAAALAEPDNPLPALRTPDDFKQALQQTPAPLTATIWRAAMEATAHNARDVLCAAESFAAPASRLIASGGWLRSNELLTIRRRILGSFGVSTVREATARGAALHAGVAAGVLTSTTSLPAPPVHEYSLPPRETHL